MAHTTEGKAYPLYAITKNGKITMLVAKDPDRPRVEDVTEEVAALLKQANKKTE